MPKPPPNCPVCESPLAIVATRSGDFYLGCPNKCVRVFLTVAAKRKYREIYTDGTQAPPAPAARPAREPAREPARREPAREPAAGDAVRAGGASLDELYE